MTWSPNNVACTTTWSTLFALDESIRPFPSSATVTMKQMTFWSSTAAPEQREVKANALALRLDSIFRVVRGAVYEDGRTHDQAVQEMRDALLSGDETMEHLADVNDANYRFWQEAS